MQFEGKIIDGYQIGGLIGNGGWGEVYQASKVNNPAELAAFKVVRFDMLSDGKAQERFSREIQVMNELQHPHVVPLLGYGSVENCLYFFMQYIQGEALSDFMQQQAFSPLQAWHILEPVGKALDYMHTLGMMHRDIKPSNILLEFRSNSYHVFLADFGLAKKPEFSPLTTSGTSVGTVEYMSPESGLNPQGIDYRTDIYSLGCVAYELLLGVVPFKKSLAHLTALAHVRDPLPLPVSLHPDFPLPLQSVLVRALAKKREERYQSMPEFIEDYALALEVISDKQKDKIYWVGK